MWWRMLCLVWVQCRLGQYRGHHREDLFRGLEQAFKKEKEIKEIVENLDAHTDFCVIQNNCTI